MRVYPRTYQLFINLSGLGFMKKILLLGFSFIAFILVFFATTATINAQNIGAIDDNIYIYSENSFENAGRTDLYTYSQVLSNEPALISFWTKTGKVVSVFDIDAVNQKTKDKKISNPATQAPGISSAVVLKGGTETISTIFQTLGPGQEILHAAHHPWMFLMTLSFGTILLSLWFLRLSTGASPPSTHSVRSGQALNLV